MKIPRGILGLSSAYQKDIIPKSLYHITHSRNIPKIQSEGLKLTEDDYFGEGVFMFELSNFLKYWQQNNNSINMAKELFKYIGRRGTDISLVKIKTKNLNKQDLFIRDQKPLCFINQKYKDINEVYRAYSRKEIPESLMDEVSIGHPANDAELFNKQKAAIEYIYPEDINPENIEILGRTNFSYDNIDVIKILRQIFSRHRQCPGKHQLNEYR